MAPSFIPVEHCKKKFYQKEYDSKNFMELTEEQLVALAKKVYRMQEKTEDTLSFKTDKMTKLERYTRTLQYLTSQYINTELKSFDERVAYLIMMSDPNLVTFKEFLKVDLLSIADIEKVEDEKERAHLTTKREKTISAYQTAVRDQIGFYDAKLLKYEKLFFKRFFSETELITEVGCNNQDNLIACSKILRSFKNISDERYKELIEIAKTWLSLAPNKNNISVAAYSVVEQRELLGLANLAEQLTLFILLIDSELEMLKIYEEESKMQNVKLRITEQFGYYNEELLSLERKYHDRFCPDKAISIWSETKKSI